MTKPKSITADFRGNFPPPVRQPGLGYFSSGRVQSVKVSADGVCAKVMGSERLPDDVEMTG